MRINVIDSEGFEFFVVHFAETWFYLMMVSIIVNIQCMLV